MASFYNLPFDEAFQKIASGLAGETEPLRRLGINMSVANLEAYALAQGIETAWDKMSAGEQLILRQKYLFQATADAQGDFLRTNDSYSNTIKRIETSLDTLKANLGEQLLSIVNPITSFMADFLEMITLPKEKNVFDEAADSMAEAEANATQATGILDYLDELYKKYGEAATQTGEWAAAMERLKQVFPEISGYIDEQTGKLKATNDELKDVIENTKQASIEESKRNAIQKLQNDYYAASANYGTAQANADFAASQMDVIAEALIEKIAENYGKTYGNMPGFEQLGTRDYWRNEIVSGARNMDDLFMEARIAMGENGQDTSFVDQLQSDYEAYASTLSSASAEMETLKSQMESLQGQIATAESVLASLATSASAAAENLDAVASSGGGGGGGGFNISLGGKGNPSVMMTSFAAGLDNVPFDGFLASLHEGESILTAEEARVWRNMKYGPSLAGNQFDYGAMGSAIGANMPNFNGMEVRWNGQVLGRVIAAQQADSLRTMERSGWRG
jgi:ABC-type transporter Mla subunit MlaD